MNKKIIIGFGMIALFLGISLFFTQGIFTKQTYCNVGFKDIVYEFMDSNGNSILVLDVEGNLFIKGLDVQQYPNPSSITNGLNIKCSSGNCFTFNGTNVRIKGDILQQQSIPSSAGSNDVLLKNPMTQESLAIFEGTTGDLKVKGFAIYFNSTCNCTISDGYVQDDALSWFWNDTYCDLNICNFDYYDLDQYQNLCEGNGMKFGLPGEITDCCEDDLNEFNLTRMCDSGCTTDPDDEACCNNINDAVYSETCYSDSETTCDSDTVIENDQGTWELNEDCLTHCENDCQIYTDCSNGDCDELTNVTHESKCLEDTGIIESSIINSEFQCSNASGSMTYNDNGNWSCQSTCDGAGNSDGIINCIDCSQPGTPYCACDCSGYNQEETELNGNTCFDGIDNDCDGSVDTDLECCTDSDDDGFFVQDYCSGDQDCDDEDNTSYPGNTETCDTTDHDCDGNPYNGFSYDSCSVYCGSKGWHYYSACCEDGIGTSTFCMGSGKCNGYSYVASHCGDGQCESACGESCSNCATDCGTCPPPCNCGWSSYSCYGPDYCKTYICSYSSCPGDGDVRCIYNSINCD